MVPRQACRRGGTPWAGVGGGEGRLRWVRWEHVDECCLQCHFLAKASTTEWLWRVEACNVRQRPIAAHMADTQTMQRALPRPAPSSFTCGACSDNGHLCLQTPAPGGLHVGSAVPSWLGRWMPLRCSGVYVETRAQLGLITPLCQENGLQLLIASLRSRLSKARVVAARDGQNASLNATLLPTVSGFASEGNRLRRCLPAIWCPHSTPFRALLIMPLQ